MQPSINILRVWAMVLLANCQWGRTARRSCAWSWYTDRNVCNIPGEVPIFLPKMKTVGQTVLPFSGAETWTMDNSLGDIYVDVDGQTGPTSFSLVPTTTY